MHLILVLCHILGNLHHIITLYSKGACILVSYSWHLVLLHHILKGACILVHVFLCQFLVILLPYVRLFHILGNLILLHCIPRGACILVSYSWQPRIITLYSKSILVHHIPKGIVFLCHILGNLILTSCIIAPYSERCMYSCVIFLATSYYCTILCAYCILVSYSWQPRIITPYCNICISRGALIATLYYCTVFQEVRISYSWQPHIIAPYSKRCAYSCVIFYSNSYYCTVFRWLHTFLCHTTCVV